MADPSQLQLLVHGSGRDLIAAHENAGMQGDWDFADTDFTLRPSRLAMLRNFIFGRPVNFKGCTFPADFSFAGTVFQNGVDLADARFGNCADVSLVSSASLCLQGVTFEGDARIGCSSVPEIRFTTCKCNGTLTLLVSGDQNVIVDKCRFASGFRLTGGVSSFVVGDTVISGHADFSSSTFNEIARFGPGLELCGDSTFRNSTFAKEATFESATFEGKASFVDTLFGVRVSFRHCRFADDVDLSATNKERPLVRAFLMQDCEVKGCLSMGGRKLAGPTHFRRVEFAVPPNFHDADVHQDTVFDAVDFEKGVAHESGERAFRTLKLAMHKHLALREELFFFRLEMRARMNQEKRWSVWSLYRIYGAWSDFGLSVRRPVVWLIISLVVFGSLTWVLVDHDRLMNCVFLRGAVCEYDRGRAIQIASLSVAQSLPFIPVVRELGDTAAKDLGLKNDGYVALFYIVLAGLQAICSLILLFLAGLGLRNMFRLGSS